MPVDRSYDETSLEEWRQAFLAFRWVPGQVGGGDFKGACPRCEHPMAVPVGPYILEGRIQSDPGVYKIMDLQADDGSKHPAVLARCNCTYDHVGRPKDVTRGCGARGALLVEP